MSVSKVLMENYVKFIIVPKIQSHVMVLAIAKMIFVSVFLILFSMRTAVVLL